MIYDSKETFMSIEDNLFVDGKDRGKILRYEVDGNGLEEGKRYLHIPYGVTSMSEESFKAYNSGGIVLTLMNKLVDPDQAREDWQKQLRGQRAIKINFPVEVGKTYFEKAEFMRKKELRVRFLRLYLPETLTDLKPFALPNLLESITVDEKNPKFTSKEGVLFSKDMKTLLRYPGYRDDTPAYKTPNEVEVLAEGAFRDAVLTRLEISEGVKEIETGCFDNTIIDELVLPDSMETIGEKTFVNCDIRKIVMPKHLKKIEDYAFWGCAGISQIITEKEPEMGRGIFSGGYFKDVSWWPWTTIPQGAFLNATIKSIRVPEGVKYIEDLAFAGCYKAKNIILPDSVVSIEADSFDQGDTYSGPVTIPEHLLKYTYRFPALSKINGMMKSKAWKMRNDKDYMEKENILRKQQKAMGKYIESVNVLQSVQKIAYKMEKQYVESMLNTHMELEVD